MFLLDTDTLSEPIRRAPHPLVMQRWRDATRDVLHTSVVTVMELRFGAAKSTKPAALWGRIEGELLSRCVLMPFSPDHALRAGEIQATLARSNLALEWRDVMIASVASHHDCTLVTRNTRHFERILGLKVENWFESLSATDPQQQLPL